MAPTAQNKLTRKQSIIMEVPTCCPSFAPVEEAKGINTNPVRKKEKRLIEAKKMQYKVTTLQV